MLTDADRPVRDIDPRVAAKYVAQHDIRLHTVAIGAASYEAEDKQTTTLVYHPTSLFLLEQIAKYGNGKFFWARDHKSLQQTLIAINEAEKKKVKTEPEYIQHPLYYWPIFIILAWFLIVHLYSIIWPQRWTS